MPYPTFTTKRLRLPPLADSDLDGLHACFGDKEAMRYWNFPACKSETETGRWLKQLAKTTSPTNTWPGPWPRNAPTAASA